MFGSLSPFLGYSVLDGLKGKCWEAGDSPLKRNGQYKNPSLEEDREGD